MVKLTWDEKRKHVLELEHEIHFETDTKTIQELINHWKDNCLILSPAFQRESVWTMAQRRKLIKSIYENVPIPSILLYERSEDGKVVYDVIDGKQRLESILMFMQEKGFRNKGYWFKAEWKEEDEYGLDRLFWKQLDPTEQAKIKSYPIQTTTVRGSLADIAEVFVRINSTGSKLKLQEIRRARYLKSEFLKGCQRLAEHFRVRNYLLNNGILSTGDVSRMRHVELVSELLLSIHSGGLLNRKKAIDDAMSADTIKGQNLDAVVRMFLITLDDMRKLFPNLGTTRFRGVADFYTLFMLVWKWRNVDKYVLRDRRKNRFVQMYLEGFGNNVDRVREKQRNMEPREDHEEAFAAYLRTVQSATDDIANRKNRQQILESVFAGCFDAKDPERTFNPEQRRILWYLSKGKCSHCRKKLNATGFHVHHVVLHSKGGRTVLRNAQILCPTCHRQENLH